MRQSAAGLFQEDLNSNPRRRAFRPSAKPLQTSQDISGSLGKMDISDVLHRLTWLKDSGTSTWQPCQHSFHPFHPGVLTRVVTTMPDVEKVSSAQYRVVFLSQTRRKSRNRTSSLGLNISSRGTGIALRRIFVGMLEEPGPRVRTGQEHVFRCTP